MNQEFNPDFNPNLSWDHDNWYQEPSTSLGVHATVNREMEGIFFVMQEEEKWVKLKGKLVPIMKLERIAREDLDRCRVEYEYWQVEKVSPNRDYFRKSWLRSLIKAENRWVMTWNTRHCDTAQPSPLKVNKPSTGVTMPSEEEDPHNVRLLIPAYFFDEKIDSREISNSQMMGTSSTQIKEISKFMQDKTDKVDVVKPKNGIKFFSSDDFADIEHLQELSHVHNKLLSFGSSLFHDSYARSLFDRGKDVVMSSNYFAKLNLRLILSRGFQYVFGLVQLVVLLVVNNAEIFYRQLFVEMPERIRDSFLLVLAWMVNMGEVVTSFVAGAYESYGLSTDGVYFKILVDNTRSLFDRGKCATISFSSEESFLKLILYLWVQSKLLSLDSVILLLVKGSLNRNMFENLPQEDSIVWSVPNGVGCCHDLWSSIHWPGYGWNASSGCRLSYMGVSYLSFFLKGSLFDRGRECKLTRSVYVESAPTKVLRLMNTSLGITSGCSRVWGSMHQQMKSGSWMESLARRKQKFIELLGRGSTKDHDATIDCIRIALALCAVNAYPEAYVQFKHVLLAFIFDKNDQNGKREFDIAGLFSSVLRAAYDPYYWTVRLSFLRTSLWTDYCYCVLHNNYSIPSPRNALTSGNAQQGSFLRMDVLARMLFDRGRGFEFIEEVTIHWCKGCRFSSWMNLSSRFWDGPSQQILVIQSPPMIHLGRILRLRVRATKSLLSEDASSEELCVVMPGVIARFDGSDLWKVLQKWSRVTHSQFWDQKTQNREDLGNSYGRITHQLWNVGKYRVCADASITGLNAAFLDGSSVK